MLVDQSELQINRPFAFDSIVVREWTFPDATKDSGRITFEQFPERDNFSVQLRIETAKGRTDSINVSLTIPSPYQMEISPKQKGRYFREIRC